MPIEQPIDLIVPVDALRTTGTGPGPGEVSQVLVYTVGSRARFRLDALGWYPPDYGAEGVLVGLRDGARLVESYGVMQAEERFQPGSIPVPILTAPTYFNTQVVHWLSTTAAPVSGNPRTLRIRGMLIEELPLVQREPRRGAIDAIVSLFGVGT